MYIKVSLCFLSIQISKLGLYFFAIAPVANFVLQTQLKNICNRFVLSDSYALDFNSRKKIYFTVRKGITIHFKQNLYRCKRG